MTEYLQVSTAVAEHQDAQKIAASAVTARLAASAQIVGPVETVFWHEGELGTGAEYVVHLVTTTDRYPALQAHLIEVHPWSNPQVTAVTWSAGSPQYFAWVQRTVSEPA